MYKQMLPDAMSQGVTAAGGLGLARVIYGSSVSGRVGVTGLIEHLERQLASAQRLLQR